MNIPPQVIEISILLRKKPKIMNSRGATCKINGKVFLTKHLYMARGLLKAIKDKKKELTKGLSNEA